MIIKWYAYCVHRDFRIVGLARLRRTQRSGLIRRTVTTHRTVFLSAVDNTFTVVPVFSRYIMLFWTSILYRRYPRLGSSSDSIILSFAFCTTELFLVIVACNNNNYCLKRSQQWSGWRTRFKISHLAVQNKNKSTNNSIKYRNDWKFFYSKYKSKRYSEIILIYFWIPGDDNFKWNEIEERIHDVDPEKKMQEKSYREGPRVPIITLTGTLRFIILYPGTRGW